MLFVLHGQILAKSGLYPPYRIAHSQRRPDLYKYQLHTFYHWRPHISPLSSLNPRGPIPKLHLFRGCHIAAALPFGPFINDCRDTVYNPRDMIDPCMKGCLQSPVHRIYVTCRPLLQTHAMDEIEFCWLAYQFHVAQPGQDHWKTILRRRLCSFTLGIFVSQPDHWLSEESSALCRSHHLLSQILLQLALSWRSIIARKKSSEKNYPA